MQPELELGLRTLGTVLRPLPVTPWQVVVVGSLCSGLSCGESKSSWARGDGHGMESPDRSVFSQLGLKST